MSDWVTLPLSEICTSSGEYGAGAAGVSNAQSWPRYIRITDISDEGNLLENDIKYISPDEAQDYLLKPGDLLFARSGATVGKTYLHKSREAAAFAGYLIRFKPDKTKVLPEFLSAFTHSTLYEKWIASMMRAGAQPNINAQEYASLPVSLPPLKEQRKIVEILSDCDAAIASLTQEKQSTERALTFSRKEIFRPYVCGTDTEKQAEPIHKLGELFSERVETGNENLPLVSITMGRGVIPREEVGRRDSSSDDKSNYRRICVGDIGYNTMRMWQGVNGLSSMDGIVSPAYTICVPNTEKIHPDWVAHLFKEKRMIFEFWRHSQGLVNDTLGLKFPAFAEIKIRTPNLQTQSNDVQHMAALFEHHSLLDAQIENLKQQKCGLMQQLLTGKLRVKGAA